MNESSIKFYIYTIHNIINNKIYVGWTKSPRDRWTKHKRIANGHREVERFYLHRALSKYGVSNFTFTVIQEFSNQNDAHAAEMYWIKFFKSSDANYGYNLTNGGEGVSGRKMSDETKKKISDAHKGMKHTEETKDLLRIINIGKKHSSESIKKMSDANKGKKLTKDHKQKISISNKGRPKSKEHIEAFTISLKNKFKNDEEYRDKIMGALEQANQVPRVRGESSGTSKLTETDVIEIRKLAKKGKHTHKEIAKMFPVSRRNISHIVNRSTWTHI